jgi:hypothetical protein
MPSFNCKLHPTHIVESFLSWKLEHYRVFSVTRDAAQQQGAERAAFTVTDLRQPLADALHALLSGGQSLLNRATGAQTQASGSTPILHDYDPDDELLQDLLEQYGDGEDDAAQ